MKCTIHMVTMESVAQIGHMGIMDRTGRINHMDIMEHTDRIAIEIRHILQRICTRRIIHRKISIEAEETYSMSSKEEMVTEITDKIIIQMGITQTVRMEGIHPISHMNRITRIGRINQEIEDRTETIREIQPRQIT